MAVKKPAKRTPGKTSAANLTRKTKRAAPHTPKPVRPKTSVDSRRRKTSVPAPPSLLVFSEVPWKTLAKGAREKALERGGVKLRLLELLGSFEEPAWCLKGHAGVVLEGIMELALDGGPVRYAEGQGFLLLPGEDRHRASAITKRVLLFVVDFEAPEAPYPRFY